jgi:hypothetical protein
LVEFFRRFELSDFAEQIQRRVSLVGVLQVNRNLHVWRSRNFLKRVRGFLWSPPQDVDQPAFSIPVFAGGHTGSHFLARDRILNEHCEWTFFGRDSADAFATKCMVRDFQFEDLTFPV